MSPLPFPGTMFTKELEAEGRILTRDWSKYHEGSVVFQPKLMEKDELERGVYETVKNVNSLALILSRSIAHQGAMLYVHFLQTLWVGVVSEIGNILTQAVKIIMLGSG